MSQDDTTRHAEGSDLSSSRDVETEQTVISTSPPLPRHSSMAGLRPRDLGQVLEGQHLDHFLLEKFVGGGGMGAVFRALDTKLHRTVAVKVLSTYQAGDEGTKQRFQVEARSAARLDHPHIARVHYVGESQGVCYIVFEYIDGTNVRDVVYGRGPLPLADAIHYTLQITDALLHIWQQGVVHRDIKPSNILITQDGQAKLVDMGLARLEAVDKRQGAEGHEQKGEDDRRDLTGRQEQPADLTSSGMTIGTFDYISPEQARNPRQADIRSDIYSLGCTLYFMLAGQPPFPEGTMLQKLLQHQGDQPPDLHDHRPDLPESVVELVETMLEKKQEDRFQNPSELAAALVAVTEQLGIGHPQLVLPALLPTRSEQNQNSWLRRYAPWLGAAVLLGLSLFVLQYLWTTGEQSPPFLRQELVIGGE